mgnify:CR=1 FL=1
MIDFELDIDTSETRMTLRKLLRRPKYRYRAVNRTVPHIPWIILIIMSVYFYKARLADESGYNFLQMMHSKMLWVEGIGYTKLVAQIVPAFLLMLTLPLKYALIAYSITPTLFIYTIFIFVYYGLRDQRSGFLILISQTIGILHGFFIPTFGLYFAIPLCIAFNSFWKVEQRTPSVIWILIILEICALLTHPLAFVLFLVIFFYNIKNDRIRTLYEYLPYILTFFAVCAGFWLRHFYLGENGVLFKHSYALKIMLGTTVHWQNFKDAFLFAFKTHTELLICSVAALGVLIKRKEWFNLILLLSCLIIYTLFTKTGIISAGSFISDLWIYPLILVAFLPLIYFIPKTPQTGVRNMLVVGLFILIGYNIYRIATLGSGLYHRARQIEFLTEVAHQKGTGKYIVDSETINPAFAVSRWTLPIEALLIGNENHKKNSVCLATTTSLEYNNNQHMVKPDEFLLNRFEIKKNTWLNNTYFNLPHQPYKLLKDTTQNNATDMGIAHVEITIHSKQYFYAGEKAWIWVEANNKQDTPIYAGKNNNISFVSLWEKDGEVLNWDVIQVPIHADIIHSLKQYIQIKAPSVKGKLKLKVDIKYNDNWIGIRSGKDVIIY